MTTQIRTTMTSPSRARAYTHEDKRRGLSRLYLIVVAVIGLTLGPAAYSVLEMGALPTCI